MIVLGSTGSIGVNTLIIAKKYNLHIDVLVAGKNIELLNQQIRDFNPRVVVIASKDDIYKVQHNRVYSGIDSVLDIIEESNSDLVVNSLVGFLGLRPTIKSIECGKRVALANKESLVVAGKFVDISKIIPIDSEHFGLWYLLDNKPISSMTITASGGSFRDTPLEKLKNVTLKEALNHPNWSMGAKITIDSATMTNKLFEILEAYWLFGVKNIDAIIETKSIIHALVNFTDGSTTAHMANPDMKLPISYAILDKVEDNIISHIDLLQVKTLEFREIKKDRYPIWEVKDYLLDNPHLGVVVNAANEKSIDMFVDGKISFTDIAKNTIKALEKYNNVDIKSLENIFDIDRDVRGYISTI
jgi:1-deoxy-D-xylulose-5-phosphate reductoisomerase